MITNYVPVKWATQVYVGNAIFKAGDYRCGTVVIINQGNNPLVINQHITLQPGAQITYESYPPEVNISDYQITFPIGTQQGATNNKAVFLYKIYQQ
jgi:hypothetical protein